MSYYFIRLNSQTLSLTSGEAVTLFSHPPKIGLGEHLYAIELKGNLTPTTHYVAGGHAPPPQHYFKKRANARQVDERLGADVYVVDAAAITRGIYLGKDVSGFNLEDVIRERLIAEGISEEDIEVVEERVQDFVRDQREFDVEDSGLSEETQRLIKTALEKGYTVSKDNVSGKVIINAKGQHYYRSQQEVLREELAKQREAQIEYNYQTIGELEQQQITHILGGASAERTIQRMNSEYDLNYLPQDAKEEAYRQLFGDSVGRLERELNSSTNSLRGSEARGLSASFAMAARQISEANRLKDKGYLRAEEVSGFIDRPDAQTYRGLFSLGNVKAVQFQFQHEGIIADLLTTDKTVNVLTQRLSPEKLDDATTRSIFAANEVYISADVALAHRENRERRIKGVRYAYSFHPKTGYIYDDNKNIKKAYISTQNYTASLDRRSTVENLMVFNNDLANSSPTAILERQIAYQIGLAVDLMHDKSNRVMQDVHSSDVFTLSNRNELRSEYNELLGSLKNREITYLEYRQKTGNSLDTLEKVGTSLKGSKQYIFFNEDIQLQMFKLMEETLGSGSNPNRRMILSFGDISSLYHAGDSRIKSILNNLLTQPNPQNRLTILTSQSDLFNYLADTPKRGTLVHQLVDAGILRTVPTMLQHDKSYVVYEGDTLVGIGDGSGNLSKTSYQYDVELGLSLVSNKKGDEASQYLNQISRQVNRYYGSLMNNSKATVYRAETRNNLAVTEELYGSLFELSKRVEGIKVSKRFDIARKGSPLSGVEVNFGGRTIVLTANREGQIVSAQDNRVISASLFKNNSNADWLLELPGLSRTLKGGESVKLTSLQTAVSMVGTISRAVSHELKYSSVHSTYIKMTNTSVGTSSAITSQIGTAINKTLGNLLTNFGSKFEGNFVQQVQAYIVTGDRKGLSTKLNQLISMLGSGEYSPDKSYIVKGSHGYAIDYRQRYGVLSTVFRPLLEDNEMNVNIAANKVIALLHNSLIRTGGGPGDDSVLQDLKAMVVGSTDIGGQLLLNARQGLVNRVISAIISPFTPAHESGSTGGQRLSRTPFYTVDESRSKYLSAQETLGANGFAYLNPGVLKHGMGIGQASDAFFRSLSSVSYTNNRDYGGLTYLREVSTTDGEFAGAALLFDNEVLLKSGGALQQYGLGEYIDLLVNNGLSESQAKQIVERVYKKYSGKRGDISLEELRGERLTLMPFSKPEQITQRLKNYIGAKETLELNPEFRKALESGEDLSQFFNEKGEFAANRVSAGEIGTSVPEMQYDQLRETIFNYGLGADLLSELRDRLLDDTSTLNGIVRSSKLRRVAVAMGHGMMGDTIAINSKFLKEHSFGTERTITIRISSQGLEQGQQFIADLENKLSGAVIYSGDQEIENHALVDKIQKRFDKLRGKRGKYFLKSTKRKEGGSYRYSGKLKQSIQKSSLISLMRISKKVNKGITTKSVLENIRAVYPNLRVSLENREGRIAVKNISLQRGVYNIVGGEYRQVARFDKDGRLILGAIEVGESLDPLTMASLGLSQDSNQGIAVLGKKVSIINSGSVTYLQVSSLVTQEYGTGSRFGGGFSLKGPFVVAEEKVFNMLEEHMTKNVHTKGKFSGSQSAINSTMMAVIHPGLMKGYNYEAGLDIIADKVSRTNLINYISTNQKDAVLALSLLLGGKTKDKGKADPTMVLLRDKLVERYRNSSVKEEREFGLILKYNWDQITGKSANQENLIMQAFGLAKLDNKLSGGESSIERILGNIRERLVSAIDNNESAQLLLEDLSKLFAQVERYPEVRKDVRVLSEGDMVLRAAGLIADAISITTQIVNWKPLDLAGNDIRALQEMPLVDSKGEALVEKYVSDKEYRNNVNQALSKLGQPVRYYRDLENKDSEDPIFKEIATKMQFLQKFLNNQVFIERAISANPSKSLVAAGMKETVGLEYQYLAGMSSATYTRFQGTLGGLVNRDDFTHISSAYAILTSINASSSDLTEFQLMRSRTALLGAGGASLTDDDLIRQKLVLGFNEFIADASFKESGTKTNIFEATVKRLKSTTDIGEKTKIVKAYEHWASLTLDASLGDENKFEPKERIKNFFRHKDTQDSLKVLGIETNYIHDQDIVASEVFKILKQLKSKEIGIDQLSSKLGIYSTEVQKQMLTVLEKVNPHKGYSEKQIKEIIEGTNKQFEDILRRSLELGPDRMVSGLINYEALSLKHNDQIGAEWARKTTMISLPTFSVEAVGDGSYRLLAVDGSNQVGIQLGTDVLRQYTITSAGYAGGLATNQLKMRLLEGEVARILRANGGFKGDGSDIISQYDAQILMEYRSLMQASISDMSALATTAYAKKAAGDNRAYPGVSMIAVNSYLLSSKEAAVGSRADDYLPKVKELAEKLAEGAGNDITKRVKQGIAQRLLHDLDVGVVEAIINRAGGPSYASASVDQSHQIVPIKDLVKRGKDIKTAFVLSEEYSNNALIMPTNGRFFTQGGDFDGDSYGIMFRHQNYFNQYAELIREEVKARVSLETIKEKIKNTTDEQTLKQLQTDEEKYSQLLDKNVDGSIGQLLHLYESKIKEDKINLIATMRLMETSLRSWTASYTSLPETYFASPEEGGILSLDQVRMMNEQFRGIDTFSSVIEDPTVQTINKLTKTFRELNKGISNGLKNSEFLTILRDSTYLEGNEEYKSLSIEDRDRLQDFLKETFAQSDDQLDAETRQSLFDDYLVKHAQVTAAATMYSNKVIGNASGTVLDSSTFNALQSLVGTQGSIFIGEAYNAITPLIYKGMLNAAFAESFKGINEDNDIRDEFMSRLKGSDPSALSIEEQQVLSKLESSDLGHVVSGADRRWRAIRGLLGNIQQLARDSLKEKQGKGIIELLLQNSGIADITEAQKLLEGDDQTVQQNIKTFISERYEVAPDGSLTGKSKLTAFGAVFLLSDYVQAADVSEMRALIGLNREGEHKGKFGWLQQQYDHYLQRGGDVDDYDTFLASTILKQIKEAQINFALDKSFTEENADINLQNHFKQRENQIRALDLSIDDADLNVTQKKIRKEFSNLSSEGQVEYLKAWDLKAIERGGKFAVGDSDTFASKTRLDTNVSLKDKNALVRTLTRQVMEYNLTYGEGGEITVEDIKQLREMQQADMFTDGESKFAIGKFMENLQRGKLDVSEHQGGVARLLISAQEDGFTDSGSAYINMMSEEIIKGLGLSESEGKIFTNMLGQNRNAKGTALDLIMQTMAGTSEMVRTQEEFHKVANEVVSLQNAPTQAHQQAMLEYFNYLKDQSHAFRTGGIQHVINVGQRKINEINQEVTATHDIENKVKTFDFFLNRQKTKYRQLEVAQNVGIWGGPLISALLVGGNVRADERTALAAKDIVQSLAYMQAAQNPLTANIFRKKRLYDTMQVEGSAAFGAVQGGLREVFITGLGNFTSNMSEAMLSESSSTGPVIGAASEFVGVFASMGLSRIFSFLNPVPEVDASINDFIHGLQQMMVVQAWHMGYLNIQQQISGQNGQEFHDTDDLMATLDFNTDPVSNDQIVTAFAMQEFN